jgi:hypothetical protein
MPPLERHARWSGMLEKHYTLDGRGYLRLVNPQPCCDSLIGNTRETIARFHGSFAVLFSPLFMWWA